MTEFEQSLVALGISAAVSCVAWRSRATAFSLPKSVGANGQGETIAEARQSLRKAIELIIRNRVDGRS